MPRHASILRRKQRTRRERMLVRLQTAAGRIGSRWERLRHRRRRRAAQHRAQDLFLQLGHRLRHEVELIEPSAPAHRVRTHVRVHRRPID